MDTFPKRKIIIISLIILVVIIAIIVLAIMANQDKEKTLLTCGVEDTRNSITWRINYNFTMLNDELRIYQIYDYSTSDDDRFDDIKRVVEYSKSTVESKIKQYDYLDANDVTVDDYYGDNEASLTVIHKINEENMEEMSAVLDFDYYSSSVDEIYEHLTKEGDLRCTKH